MTAPRTTEPQPGPPPQPSGIVQDVINTQQAAYKAGYKAAKDSK